MHDDRIHADQVEQDYVLGEAETQIFAEHGVAAILDDDGLAAKAPDVGQRFDQNLGSLNEIFHVASAAHALTRQSKQAYRRGAITSV
jgi:hypothetical protein